MSWSSGSLATICSVSLMYVEFPDQSDLVIGSSLTGVALGTAPKVKPLRGFLLSDSSKAGFGRSFFLQIFFFFALLRV